MTVAEAQERVTAREFAEWQAYYRLEPFGEYRADYRMGVLAAITANLWKEKGEEPTRPEDFLPRFGRAAEALEQEPARPPPGTTDDEFRTALMALGKVKRGNSSPP